MDGLRDTDQKYTDELTIDAEKVPLIESNKERLSNNYRVELEYGLKATDNVTPKQWITITGQTEDRSYAKNYIRALCNAAEQLCIQYPVELHSILTNPKIQTRLEKQSKTAIQFDPGRVGEACIFGMDTLAVTLAFSAVEDIIAKYSEDGDDEAMLESPIAKLASSRLDTELQRLHAQDKEIMYDDDYSKMPDAVKRSILNWYLEDPNAASEDASSQKMVKSDGKTADAYQADTVNQVRNQLKNTQINSTSTRKKTDSENGTADTIGYLVKPSDFVIPTIASEASLLPASLPQENSLLRETGISHGYTDKEINTVLIASEGPMRTSEFIRALVANRKMDKKASSATVQDSNNRSGNTEANSNTLVSDALTKHPMDEFLSGGSPTVKSKQPHSQSPKLSKESGDQQNFVDYFAKLSQDFEEEAGEVELEELKRRSKERQKLFLDALMKQKVETQSGEEVEVVLSEEDTEETEDLAGDENPDNPDGWEKSGVMPKKQRRNKKKRNNQSPFQTSILQDRTKNSSEQNYGHEYSSSPGKHQDFTGFKQPNSPKKRIPNQNQQRFPSHSPHGKQSGGRQRYSSPSPSKEWQSRQSPKNLVGIQNQEINVTTEQHISRQQEFNALRQQHQRMPFQGFQQPPIQTTNIFGGSHSQRQQFNPQQHQPQQYKRSQPVQSRGRPVVKGRKNLRYIIIDGSNVAMAHGNLQMFSCRGIEICVNYFLQRGHTQITAFVPQWRCRTNLAPGYEVYDQHVLEELREKGYLVYTPARRVPGKNIVCYDDRFVIRLAKETDGIIVSNDNYRDLWYQNSEWRSIIEQRLLMFTFVGDIFMPPDDPLGRDGPILDDFLQKSDLLDNDQTSVLTGVSPGQQKTRHDNQGRFPDRGQQVDQHARNKGPLNTRMPPPVQTHQPNQGLIPRGYQPHGAATNPIYVPQAKGNMQYRQQQPNYPNTATGNKVQHANPVTGAMQGSNSKPLRTKEVTNWLAANLEKIFANDADKVRRILENHPFETDMNKLSSYILEIL